MPASVVVSIRNGFSQPFRPLALCRKGHVSSTTNWTSLSRRDCTDIRFNSKIEIDESLRHGRSQRRERKLCSPRLLCGLLRPPNTVSACFLGVVSSTEMKKLTHLLVLHFFARLFFT